MNILRKRMRSEIASEKRLKDEIVRVICVLHVFFTRSPAQWKRYEAQWKTRPNFVAYPAGGDKILGERFSVARRAHCVVLSSSQPTIHSLTHSLSSQSSLPTKSYTPKPRILGLRIVIEWESEVSSWIGFGWMWAHAFTRYSQTMTFFAQFCLSSALWLSKS